MPLPGLRTREEPRGLRFLLLRLTVNAIFFFAMTVASFSLEFFFPCLLLASSLITRGTVQGWTEPIQSCRAHQASPGRTALYYMAVKTGAGGQRSADPSPQLPDGWLFQHILRATVSHPRYASPSDLGLLPPSPSSMSNCNLGGNVCSQGIGLSVSP